MTWVRLPEDDLPPVERVAALSRKLAAARDAVKQLAAEIAADEGPTMLTLAPALHQMAERAALLAPFVSDAEWWCAEYVAADRDHDACVADLRAAETAHAAGPSDQTLADLHAAAALAAGAAAARAELRAQWQVAEDALAAAASPQPVVTLQDVDNARAQAVARDYAVLSDARWHVQVLAGALYRAERAAAGHPLPDTPPGLDGAAADSPAAPSRGFG